MTHNNKKMYDALRLHPNILKMHQYCQHGNMSTYEHCINVTEQALKIAKHFDLTEAQERNIIIGAMLHDYYLYDWHDGRKRPEGIHAWSHPKKALHNAIKDFKINEHQRNIIRSHMFPMTLLHPPKNIEAWIVTMADKYCAAQETLTRKDFTLISKKFAHTA